MAGEAVTLSWTDFERNCPITFQRLWETNEFTDVTLATEDDGQIQAHKVILSSASAFFNTNLLASPNITNFLVSNISYKELQKDKHSPKTNLQDSDFGLM